MKVRLRDILCAGIDYAATVRPASIGLEGDHIDFERPVSVQGRLTRVDDFILARLEVRYTQDTVCSRCLDKINSDVVIPLECDIECVPGEEFVDIGFRVREEIIMARQPRSLCREDCRGICAGCGAYLNEEPCSCGQHSKEQGNA